MEAVNHSSLVLHLWSVLLWVWWCWFFAFFHILSIAERRLTNTKAMSPAFLLSQSFGWLPHWRLTWSKQAIITVHVYITSYRLKPNGILQYRICKALIITLYNYIIKKMKEKRGTRKIMDILLDNIKKNWHSNSWIQTLSPCFSLLDSTLSIALANERNLCFTLIHFLMVSS